MELIFATNAILATIAGLYFVWLLQLNSYYFNRAKKNIFVSKCFWFSIVFSVIQTVLCICDTNIAVWIGTIFFALLCTFVFIKKKVNLKLTARVIRWGVVMLATNFVLAFCAEKWFFTATVFPVVYFSHIMTLPIQFVINRYYIDKAQKKLNKMNCVIVTIVGSFGKTSIKNILQVFLSTNFKTECSPNSFNTLLGLTKFINSADCTNRVLILEAGAKKSGDISEICKAYTPRHAIITGVTEQHLSEFKTLDNIKSTKGEILDYLKHGAFCVLNSDDINSSQYFLKNTVATKLSCGKNGKYCKLSNINVALSGTTFDLTIGDNTHRIFTPLLGSINAFNVAMAFCLATKMGCDTQKLIDAAAGLTYTPHRLQLIRLNGRYILDDSFNANKEGVKGFLEVLACFKNTKAVVSQGFVEMGGQSYQSNFNLGRQLAKVADFVSVTGQNSMALYEGLKAGGARQDRVFFAENLSNAVQKLQPFLDKDSVIAFQNDLPDNMQIKERI